LGCLRAGQWHIPLPSGSRRICANKEDDFDEIEARLKIKDERLKKDQGAREK